MRKKDNHRFCTQTIRHINSSLIHNEHMSLIFFYFSRFFYMAFFIFSFVLIFFIPQIPFGKFNPFVLLFPRFFVSFFCHSQFFETFDSSRCFRTLPIHSSRFFFFELMNSFKFFSAQSTKVHFVVVYHINNNAIGGGCYGLSQLIEQSIFHLIVL